ncbi:polysaccharide deacetylase family protein [Thermosipho atlanticus]|uniref:Polysaccharide deacetylase n=1 Tax=Thermosipho atlanticus DSM 15807 TaxID=1123380 RepID=A0A1M5TWN0_9BACT|nr:polysaccharide deacetylase family protein [Thermosipho atlanticus]SHH55104.1 Polysaccharide deacetylase [Thermosipho atlanticus DSM 15807]
MKKYLVLLFTFVVCFLSFSNIIVFVYHRFDDERYPTTNTWTSELELHINLVKKLGYKIWTLKDLEEYVYGKKEEENAVIFTIDDGYKTVYTNAFPIFKKYNIPFSVFLYFKGVGKSKEYLTWEMVKEMSEWGVVFGHHSYSHDKFPSVYKNMNKEEFIKYFESDLKKGLDIWYKHMGTSLKYYAYPYGYYNKEMIEVLKKNGFKLAFIQLSGPYNKEISPFEIPREALLEDWATESHVRYVLSREALITDNIPFYWKNEKLYVKARIKVPQNYENPVVYIREKGIVKSYIKNGILYAGPFVLSNEYNSLMISVRGENKKEYVKYYLIIK